MKMKVLILVAMVIAVAGLAVPMAVYADAPSPLNQVALEITVNEAGYLTIGGIDLRQLNVLPLDPNATAWAKSLDSVHLVLQGELVSVDVHGNPVMKMQWNQASREAMANLAARYGVQLSSDMTSRIEEWVSSSNLDVTAKFSNEPSKPVTLQISKPILVDLGQDGGLTVEKMPLAARIDPAVVSTMKAGFQNAALCFNKGTLTSKVDGKPLPTITFDPKGAQFLVKAFNLAITNVDPIFASQLGVDVSLPGGVHQAGATCGQ